MRLNLGLHSLTQTTSSTFKDNQVLQAWNQIDFSDYDCPKNTSNSLYLCSQRRESVGTPPYRAAFNRPAASRLERLDLFEEFKLPQLFASAIPQLGFGMSTSGTRRIADPSSAGGRPSFVFGNTLSPQVVGVPSKLFAPFAGRRDSDSSAGTETYSPVQQMNERSGMAYPNPRRPYIGQNDRRPEATMSMASDSLGVTAAGVYTWRVCIASSFNVMNLLYMEYWLTFV